MRFSITRLCGGMALMVSSKDNLDIDLAHASKVFSGEGEITQIDDAMMVMKWNKMEVTIYPQGKVMFHPLTDKETALKYTSELLNKLILKSD